MWCLPAIWGKPWRSRRLRPCWPGLRGRRRADCLRGTSRCRCCSDLTRRAMRFRPLRNASYGFLLCLSQPIRKNRRQGCWKISAKGFSTSSKERACGPLLLAAIPINVFTAPIFVFLPFYATNALGAPLATYGYLLATFSSGTLAGYALAGRFAPAAARVGPVVFGAVAANGAVVSGAEPDAVVPACCKRCCLCSAVVPESLCCCCLNALMAQTAPDKRGRIGAILFMIAQGLTPLLMSFVGGSRGLAARQCAPDLCVLWRSAIYDSGIDLVFSSSPAPFLRGTSGLARPGECRWT